MSIRNRVEKLESASSKNNFVIVALDPGETEAEAMERHYPPGTSRPRSVIFATPLDVEL